MSAPPEMVSGVGDPSRRVGGLIGRALGEFVIREKLGEGGFGTVFRAEQLALGREAVVKTLQPRAKVAENAIQRFMREARLASTLDHPYAAHIYAFGAEPDGLLWIAMELVRGTPLDKLLKTQGPVPLARLVPLFDRICEVVHTAHEQGIVHRDLKPANVMVLSRAGRLLPKLLDFGVAKLREESLDENAATLRSTERRTKETGDARISVEPAGTHEQRRALTLDQISDRLMRATTAEITQRGLFIGSPHYMAPEQWVNPTAADQRSDLYALGVLCFEALTGRHPFEGDTVLEIAKGHAQKDVPSPGANLPESIHQFLHRAMAKKSGDRFQSALELASAFRAAAGLSDDGVGVPQLDEAVRETVIALAPQPLAEAVSALEASRSLGQALQAAAQVSRAVAQYLGLLALACRTKVGPGAPTDSAAALELLQALRRHGLTEGEWIRLARELCQPFEKFRDAYPIPELVSFSLETAQAEAGGAKLFSDDDARGGEQSEEAKRATLERELARLSRLLRGVSFLFEYPLVVARAGRAELWMGARRTARNSRPLRTSGLPEGHAFLLDRDAAPVVSLWPVVQPIVPTPGAPEELFLLEGNGRLGAKLVSIPLGFERHDDDAWQWFGEHLVGASGEVVAAAKEQETPYLGLATFTANDAKNFFGREREAEAFANRLRMQPLLAVVGPSGAGKSSFVQAGVVPLLPSGWRAIVFRPGPAPLAALCARLAQEGLAVGELRETLAQQPALLGKTLTDWRRQVGGAAMLVVDQFEELLTLCQDATERNAFAEALVQAARSTEDSVRVVLTLRDDFLIRAQQIPALRERLAQGLQLLATPAHDDLVRILINPARQTGYEFEDPKLPEEMVQEVAEHPGALALLSFTASKLWEVRDRHFRHLSRRAYRSLGGVGGALAQHAESTLAQMPAEERSLVREAFRHLVTAERTRAIISRREMEHVLGGGPNSGKVLERLIGARLLTASEGDGSQDRIEVIHEALLTSWPRLVEWQQEDAENARMRHQLRAAARQWDERGRGKGLLWRKEALIEYRLWRSRDPGRLTETEEAFARASLADEARGRRARRTAVVLVFAALVVGLAVLFRANRVAEENARIAKSRLASSYEEQGRQLLLTGDPLRGIVYLERAMQEGASGPALRYLIGRAKWALDAQVASLQHSDYVREAHFSPDGKRIVTASFDKTAKLWDAATAKLIATLKHETKVFSARFNADGTRIVTASGDGAVRIWDGLTGAPIGAIAADAGSVCSIEVGPRFAEVFGDFNPNGTSIATFRGNAAQIWDAQRLELVATLRGHTEPILCLIFHPDGKSLFTSASDGTIKKWDDRGRLVFSVNVLTGADVLRRRVSSLSISASGARLASVGWEGTGQVWNAKSGQLTSGMRDSDVFLYSVALSPDGKYVVTAGDARAAKIWNADTGEMIRSLEGHTSAVRSVAYSSNGETLLTASADGTARLWSSSDNVPRMSLVGHVDNVSTAEFSPDLKRIVTASNDGTAKVWDAGKSFRLKSIADPDLLSFADWSSDGNRILTVHYDGKIKLRDMATDRVLFESEIDAREIDWLGGWSPDETQIIVPTKERTSLLEFPSGKTIVLLDSHDKRVLSAQFSPDSQLLATGSADHTLRIWNARNGALIRTLEGHTAEIRAVAFDGEGKRLASGGEDKKVYVWDLASGARLLEIAAFRGWIRAISFSRDGTRIATASRDKRLIIWNAQTGQVVLPIHEAKTANINFVEFNPTGDFLVTSDVAGAVSVWDAHSGRMLSSDVHKIGALSQARLSRDGQRALSVIEHDLAIWTVGYEPQVLQDISNYIKCRVPFRLESEKLVAGASVAADCAH
ncbi:MAG TPA: protein kinase [Myxococcaceae bacterium]|nr:protein kinase [Myxococcaceae bacterium]